MHKVGFPMSEMLLEKLGTNHPKSAHDSEGIPISHFPFVIGRHPRCDYLLDHPLVSRRHCVFYLQGQDVWVKDLGSRNGTSVNARPLDGAKVVEDGDLLKVAGLFFHIRLAPSALPPVAENVPEKTPSSHQTVLVVDDNKDGAETLAEYIQKLGHNVRVAHNGPEAIKAVEAQEPDTVLLDIRLPGMDGFEVAQHLRERVGLDKARLVGITGYESDQDQRKSREAGFDCLLSKPLDTAKLAKMLR
jgi:CheY-like chemotaxis protein